MKISLFKDVAHPENPEILDLIDYLIDTQQGRWEDIVNKCRRIQDEEQRDEYKRTMPTASLSGIFSYRSDKTLVTHSGILAMDLDDLGSELNIIKGRLEKDKFTFSVFMSTSGYGLRWLIKIDEKKHKESFKGAMQYLHEKYGIPADTNSSISKPYVVSFDPDLFLNPDYENVPVFDKIVKETVIKNVPSYIHNKEDFQYVYQQIIGRHINICESYDDWLKIGFGLAEEFGEDGRAFFHELSRMSDKYKYEICNKQYNACLRGSKTTGKINIRSFYYLAKVNGINIASERTKEIVRTTRNGKRAGLKPEQIANNLKEKGSIEGVDSLIDKIYNSDDKDNFEDADDSTIHVLEMFIKNYYSLRFNEISGYFENDGQAITPTAMNSIYIAAKKVLPKLDYGLMIRLLKSDFIPIFNPFFEFWHSDGIPVILPPNPVDNNTKFESPIIDKLAQCIINEKEAFTRYFLRKWCVSIVSAAHKIHSPLLFALLGAQHTGKTEFFRRFMPDELKRYYAESKLDKEKDDELLMCENLLIMDDELGGKSKADALKLNNLTSKQYFSLRRPYGDHNEMILRLAVLCGTSNYKQILADPHGNRRIIPTEVTDINKELYNSINKKDLFIEMFNLYKAGFDWRVMPKDLKLLNQDEERFTLVVKERELILRFFAPSEDKDAKRMSTTDVIVELEKLTQQKLNINIIGRELENLGFIRRSTRLGQYKERVRQMWIVEEINRSFEQQQQMWDSGKTGINRGEKDEDMPF